MTTRRKQSKEIPTTLSGLLNAACDDLLAIRKMKTRREDMGTYCRWDGRVCSLCMAGAVLDRRTTFTAEKRAGSQVWSPKWAQAIDCMRRGEFRIAGRMLGIAVPDEVEAEASECVDYHYYYLGSTCRAPVRNYRRAARVLAKAGL
jgi:hypothetical protein